MFLILRGVTAENKALAGKLGVMQAVLSGIERHATVAPVAERGFAALGNICGNGSLVTQCAE